MLRALAAVDDMTYYKPRDFLNLSEGESKKKSGKNMPKPGKL